jgi:hypothetical protein
MNFEVQNALVTLDKRTPSFFVAEMFGQSDLTSKKQSIEALRDLEVTGASKKLRSMLKIV